MVLVLMVVTNIAEEADLGENAHQCPGIHRRHGRDPAGLLCRVPDHGRPHYLIHGGGNRLGHLCFVYVNVWV